MKKFLEPTMDIYMIKTEAVAAWGDMDIISGLPDGDE